MYKWNIDGSTAEHEANGVDELNLGAGDDRSNDQEHGHNQDNDWDDNGHLD